MLSLIGLALVTVASTFEQDLRMFSTRVCDSECRARIQRLALPGLQNLASTVAMPSGRSKRDSHGKTLVHSEKATSSQQLCLRQFDT